MRSVRKAKGAKDQSTSAQELSVDLIGTRIREIREAADKSIAEVARAAGLPSTVLEAVESGKKDPSLLEMKKIAKGLAVPLPQIFGDLSPRGVVIATEFDAAPEEVQGVLMTILKHQWGKA
jgi:transcriptional regulator with XRE-family HTH domain